VCGCSAGHRRFSAPASSQHLLHYWSPSGFHFCCRSAFRLCLCSTHWQSLPQCRFAWPFSRRVGYSSRGLLFPVFPLPLCHFFNVCRAFAVRHGCPSPFGPYLPVGCQSLHCPCGLFVPPPPPFPLPPPVHVAHSGVFQYGVLYKF
jgi:hypothetical protein